MMKLFHKRGPGRPAKSSVLVRGIIPLVPPLILSVTLMQYHSILYWVERTGQIGWVFSVGLEVFGLWFWWRSVKATAKDWSSFKFKIAALITTCLLIYGPVLEMSRPLMIKYNTGAVTEDQIAIIQKSIDFEQKMLDEQVATAKKARGWKDSIDSRTATINTLRAELTNLTKNKNVTVSSEVMIQAMYESLVFIMFAIGQILIIREMRQKVETAKKIKPAKVVKVAKPIKAVKK